jgi:predicted transcriptional regulator
MEKHTLLKFITEGFSQREIAEKLSVSQTTVRYWLNRHDLKTFLARTEQRICRRCGETDESKLRSGCRYICKICDSKRTVERHRLYKKKAVAYKGGKCSKCGYCKCLGALDFHHTDPKQKDPDWKNMKHRSFESVIHELDKCVLVCKNCHAEIHWYSQRDF